LENLVEQQPDIYAKELQHALFTAYDVEVDATTITRALRRQGFTRKKVCPISYDRRGPHDRLGFGNHR